MSVHAPSKMAESCEPMVRPTCETCPFWERKLGQLGEAGAGECRLNAPIDTIFAHRWPGTTTKDWCGQHPKMAEYLKPLA